MARPKGMKNLEKRYFSDQQWEKFKKAIKANPLADFLFNLMMVTASRVGEIAQLRLDDIKLDENPPKVIIQGLKNGYKNSYELSLELMRKYKRWMSARKRLKTSVENSSLFITKLTGYGKSVSRDLIQLLFKIYCRKAGLNPKEFSVHSIRHTCAIQLVKAGANVPSIQAHLRQKSPASALEYIRLVGKDRQDAIQKNMPVLNRLVS